MKSRFAVLSLVAVALVSLAVSARAADGFPQVSAEDRWNSVRSKNFFLMGDVGEQDLRQVATRLEQFRETFRQLFPDLHSGSPVGTNVVVFRDKRSFLPFLPKRDDGRADTGVAGYFQSGEDVNYITLSIEDGREAAYETIFHEYVHFLLDAGFGRSEIPPWFNEGLAGYYQTFRIENDRKVYLGTIIEDYLRILQRTELIPLRTFFETDNYSLHREGDHTRTIFYAQAWALMHYLIQSGRSDDMNRFLSAVTGGAPQEKAFREAFGTDYAEMEKTLREYVRKKSYKLSVVLFDEPLLFDAGMSSAPLSEAETNAYLGDLLYHTHEYADAETYLRRALELDAGQSLANTSLGLVRMRQKRFGEAKEHLRKALAGDSGNHYAHYSYAYIISREGADEAGLVTGYPKEMADLMRRSLREAIRLRPDFAESYRLLAFINLINNEDLEESHELMKKALALRPGNEDYQVAIAGIYLRQEKLEEAERTAAKILRTAVDPDVRAEAERVLNGVRTMRASRAEKERYEREAKQNPVLPPNVRLKSALTKEEIERIERDNLVYDLNRQMGAAGSGEKRVVGRSERIECLREGVRYTVRTGEGVLKLRSRDFRRLDLLALAVDASGVSVGCDARIDHLIVFAYRPGNDPRTGTAGELGAMTFVPEGFILKTPDELAGMERIIIVDEAELERQKLESVRKALRRPSAGEKRIVGIIRKIECFRNEMIFRVTAGGRSLVLRTSSPKDVPIRIFTPEAAGTRFGCGTEPPPVSAVITYRPARDDPDAGEVVALEFVPAGVEP